MRKIQRASLQVHKITVSNPCAPRYHLVYLLSLSVLLMFGVLAFGAAEIWATSILEICAALLCTILVVHRVCISGAPVKWNPLFIPMLGFAAVITLQLAFNLTAYRYVTLLACMQYLAYGALLFVATQLEINERSSTILVLVLSIFGSAVALFSICQYLSSSQYIYWLRSPHTGSEFFGPYVNRDHYAGMMEMLTPFALVLSLSRLVHGGQRILAAFAAVVMAASIVLSLSRGGAISLVCELVLFFWILSAVQNRSLVQVRLLLLVASGLAFLVFVGTPAMWSHLQDMHETFRPDVLKDSLKMFNSKPLLGWGLGTFSTVYPGFRSFYTVLFVNAAHDDYLQALVETGIVGFTFVVWFMVVLYRKGLSLCRNESRGWRGVLRLATLVGCTGMVVHSALDFNLQLPANAALFYVFCALATSLPSDKPLTLTSAGRIRVYETDPMAAASE
jgi:O-antigen ligase